MPILKTKRSFLILGALLLVPCFRLNGQVQKQAAIPTKSAIEVRNAFDQPTTFYFFKPEGARVKKGELICELDSGNYQLRLVAQSIKANAAEAHYQNARLTREVAEIAVIEFREEQEKAETKDLSERADDRAATEIWRARLALRRALDRFDGVSQLFKDGDASRDELAQVTNDVIKAIADLNQVETRNQVHEQYITSKSLKKLKGEVEKARAVELAEKEQSAQENAALATLKQKQDSYRILAPTNGRVHYPQPIVADTTLKKGDLLFTLTPEDNPADPSPP